jgi:hypothetical protein
VQPDNELIKPATDLSKYRAETPSQPVIDQPSDHEQL